MSQNSMSLEILSDDYWLDRMYMKSNSKRTRTGYYYLEGNKMTIYACKFYPEQFSDDDTDKFDRHLQYVHGTNHWDINQALNGLIRS